MSPNQAVPAGSRFPFPKRPSTHSRVLSVRYQSDNSPGLVKKARLADQRIADFDIVDFDCTEIDVLT